VHAFDGVTVTYEVPPDNVRNGRIVVYDDDPARRIGVTYQGFPFQWSSKRQWLRLQGKSSASREASKQGESVTSP